MVEEIIPFGTSTLDAEYLMGIIEKVRKEYYGYKGTVRIKITQDLFVNTISACPACEDYPRPRKRKSKVWRDRMSIKMRNV